jgi:hypothetical protein
VTVPLPVPRSSSACSCDGAWKVCSPWGIIKGGDGKISDDEGCGSRDVKRRGD